MKMYGNYLLLSIKKSILAMSNMVLVNLWNHRITTININYIFWRKLQNIRSRQFQANIQKGGLIIELYTIHIFESSYVSSSVRFVMNIYLQDLRGIISRELSFISPKNLTDSMHFEEEDLRMAIYIYLIVFSIITREMIGCTPIAECSYYKVGIQ